MYHITYLINKLYVLSIFYIKKFIAEIIIFYEDHAKSHSYIALLLLQ